MKQIIVLIIEEILEYETYPNKKIKLINVNTSRKKVFGKCRIKGLKSKEFVKTQLENILPDLHKFDIMNRNGEPDKRNADIYDGIVLALYGE